MTLKWLAAFVLTVGFAVGLGVVTGTSADTVSLIGTAIMASIVATISTWRRPGARRDPPGQQHEDDAPSERASKQ